MTEPTNQQLLDALHELNQASMGCELNAFKMVLVGLDDIKSTLRSINARLDRLDATTSIHRPNPED